MRDASHLLMLTHSNDLSADTSDFVPAAPATLGVRLAVLAVVIIPFLALAGAIVLLWGAPFHWYYLAMFGVMYTLSTLGIGVGYHRLFTHKSFEAKPFVRLILAVFGSTAVEGPVIKWVATHRMHHQHADVPGDPHSPHGEDRPGVWGVLTGFWHAHVGWLFDADPVNLDRYVPDLLKDRGVQFVHRTFLLWVILGLLIPAALGGLLTGTWWGVLLGFLWGGLVRVLVVHHVTWSINSVCHLWGTRPFATRDESRDNPIFGVLAFGEGWHNAHHAFPTSARHGLAWWKFDLNYLIIRTLALLGLARNIRIPPPERIAAGRRKGQPEAVLAPSTP